jgi:elongation of very long chain fatty acids protein 4
MDALLDAFSKLDPIRADINALGRRVIEFANPALKYDARATRKFPLMNLDGVLALLLCYLLLVLYGLWKSSCCRARESSAGDGSPTPATAAPASPRAGAPRKSTNEKFLAEPILYLALPYNWLQVVLCAYMMVTAGVAAWERGFSPLCNAFEAKPKSMALANVLWVFYVSKVRPCPPPPPMRAMCVPNTPFHARMHTRNLPPPPPSPPSQVLDFVDTLVMIVRGKWNQFSFLHVYHHFTIFLVYWLVTNAAYDGDVYFTIVANSFIHMVMYSYYGYTTVDVKLSWGWLMTKMQLVQFVLMMLQAVVILASPASCAYPRNTTIIYFVYILTLFLLFLSFDMKRWGKKAAGAATVEGRAKAQ